MQPYKRTYLPISSSVLLTTTEQKKMLCPFEGPIAYRKVGERPKTTSSEHGHTNASRTLVFIFPSEHQANSISLFVLLSGMAKPRSPSGGYCSARRRSMPSKLLCTQRKYLIHKKRASCPTCGVSTLSYAPPFTQHFISLFDALKFARSRALCLSCPQARTPALPLSPFESLQLYAFSHYSLNTTTLLHVPSAAHAPKTMDVNIWHQSSNFP